MTTLTQQAGWISDAFQMSSGRRHAALVLHGMTASDREWLLSQLDVGQRSSLQPLLDELQELAIPPDAELVNEAVRRSRTLAAAPPEAERLVQRVAHLHPCAVSAVLGAEPAPVARRVVAMRPWPWRDEVVAALPQAASVEKPVNSGASSPPSRLECLLLEALLSRASTVPAAQPTPARRSSGVGHWLKQLRLRRLWPNAAKQV